MEPIQICMLGEFSLQAGDALLSDAGNRSRKVWGLLSYLICHRDRTVSQKKLIDLLWGEGSASTNPENALRITLHRVRSLLDQLSPGLGRKLIVYRDNGYRWNPEAEIRLDSDRFDALCLAVCDDGDLRLEQCLEAIALYRGEFLPRQSSETWVIPISSYLQNRYLAVTLEAADLLMERSQYAKTAEICRKAIAVEPYHELLYQMLMKALAAMGDHKGVHTVYETFSKRLFDDFGIRPGEKTRSVYRASAHSPGDRSLPMDEVLEHLQEPEPVPGAMECDYDYFKVLCFAESRAMERSGSITHVALLSLSSSTGKPLTRQSSDQIMNQLGLQLRMNLRRGDILSRCSTTQYILMLPKANYENSCMVCRRCIGAFTRAHPHVNAKIQYMVQPLTPSICVP